MTGRHGKNAMFTPAVINHTVKLKAFECGTNVQEVVEDRARALLEGVCGEHGLVRPDSLRMISMSRGKLTDIDMGRSYNFDAQFKVEVCNPIAGLRFNALVRSINKFGLLAEGGYYDHDGTLVPVIEIVVVRNPTTIPNEVDISELQVGDEIGVEVLGRQFEMRDTRISAYGRTVVSITEKTDGLSVLLEDAENGDSVTVIKENDDDGIDDTADNIGDESDEESEAGSDTSSISTNIRKDDPGDAESDFGSLNMGSDYESDEDDNSSESDDD